MGPDELLAEYGGLVRTIVIRGSWGRGRFEDALQESYIALLSAPEVYEEGRSRDFRSFLWRWVKWRLADWMRSDVDHLNRHERRYLSDASDRWASPLSLDELREQYEVDLPDHGDAQGAVVDRVADQQALAGFVEWVRRHRPADDLVLLALWLDGFTMLEAGYVLGCTESNVSYKLKGLLSLAAIWGREDLAGREALGERYAELGLWKIQQRIAGPDARNPRQ